jgi:hypothetical protein
MYQVLFLTCTVQDYEMLLSWEVACSLTARRHKNQQNISRLLRHTLLRMYSPTEYAKKMFVFPTAVELK